MTMISTKIADSRILELSNNILTLTKLNLYHQIELKNTSELKIPKFIWS